MIVMKEGQVDIGTHKLILYLPLPVHTYPPAFARKARRLSPPPRRLCVQRRESRPRVHVLVQTEADLCFPLPLSGASCRLIRSQRFR